MQTNKKNKNIIGIIQSFLILILVVLIIFMMIQISSCLLYTSGSICEMLAHAVKRMPYFIGKPQPEMVELALQRNHYRKEETLIVGDRLYTDILCGHHAGVETVLVLSGEATKEEAKAYEHQPDYVMSSVDELHEACLLYTSRCV